MNWPQKVNNPISIFQLFIWIVVSTSITSKESNLMGFEIYLFFHLIDIVYYIYQKSLILCSIDEIPNEN